MRYVIRKAVLAPAPEIEISEDEYSVFRLARTVLSNALGIEEKYEILIANFLELEKQLLNIAVTNTVRRTLSYSEAFDSRSALNICLVNLLTAARLYLDQLPQDVAGCIPDNPNATTQIKVRGSKEYDEHFEFRFMEALRNYVQHRGIPIHNMQQSSSWSSFGEDGVLEFAVDIAAQRRYLKEDDKFKKDVLNEAPDDIDLKAASRRYVESLSAIQAFTRDLIAESVNSARTRIEAAHKRYAEIFAGDRYGLVASAFSDNQEVSSVPLFLDWDDVRLELQKRNTQLVNLSKRYATGRLTRIER